MSKNYTETKTESEKSRVIDRNDVVKFMFREMFGTNSYDYLEKAMKSEAGSKEMHRYVRIACLRKALPDAMLHVKNKYSDNIDDIINNCEQLLENVLNEYSKEEKFDYLWDLYSSNDTKIINIKNKLRGIKKEFTFGRFQKLFNMAVKYYVCVCEFKEILGLEGLNVYSLEHANCPVDRNIVDKLKDKKDSANLPCKYKDLLKKDIKWTKIDENDYEDYIMIQEIIQLLAPTLSNLAFDFKEWK